MKWLNYHHLLYFREIAKEGSISKASEKLLVGQPALSTQLKQLEESLGVLLFERKNRSLILTEAGRLALEYADEIFNKGEDFLEAFQTKSFARKSRFRLGAVAGLPKSLVCEGIGVIKDFEPKCFVSTFEAEQEELTQRLLSHDLDIALTNDPGRPQEGVFHHLIGKSRVFVYGTEKFKILAQGFPGSLMDAPFILQTMHSKLRYDIERLFALNHLSYDLIAECQDYAVKTTLAQAGRGLVFLPEYALKNPGASNGLVKLGELGELYEEYWLLCSTRFLKQPITDKLIHSFSV